MTDEVKPGDIGIVDHPLMRNSYKLIRVAKVGNAMWDIESYYRNGEWGEPARRKVTGWQPLPRDVDADTVNQWLRAREEQFRAEERAARERLAADVADYVMRAREAEGD